MYNFSVYINDRTAPDFAGKIDICGSLMINNMELTDNFNGKNFYDLNGGELENIRILLIQNNKKIALLNCNTNLKEYEAYRLVFRKAHMLGIENIGLQPERLNEAGVSAIEDIRRICCLGKSYGIGVLFENHSKTVLSTDSEMSTLYREIRNEYTGLIFNPLEYARLKSHPFLNVFYNSRLKNEIRFLRISDGLFVDGSPALPAQGNAEIKEMASILLSRGYKGYFSFVPYYNNMSFTEYKKVIGSFKKLLIEL